MDHLADAPIANILILAGVIFLAVGLFGRVGGFIGSIFGNIEAGKNSRVMAGVLGVFLIVGGGWLHEESHKSVASNSSPAPAPGTSPAGTGSASGTPAVTPDSQPEIPKAKAFTSQPSPKKTPPVVAPDPASPALAIPARAAERENLPPTSPSRVVNDRFVGTWTNLTPRSDSIKRFEVVRVGQSLSVHLWYSCGADGDCDRGFHRLDVSGDTSTYDDTDSNKRRVGHLSLQTPTVLLLAMDFTNLATQRRGRNNWVFVKSTLGDKMQSAFAKYLNAPLPKAFALAPGGVWSYHLGGHSADDATEKALVHCEERGATGCRIILVNDDPAQ